MNMELKDAAHNYFNENYDPEVICGVGVDLNEELIIVYTRKKWVKLPDEWLGYPVKKEYVGIIKI